MTDPAGNPEGDLDSPLVDLSGLTLDDIARLPDSVLGTALRAVTDAASRPDGLFTAEYKEIHVRY